MKHAHEWREFWALLAVIAWLVTAAIAFGWVTWQWARHPTLEHLFGGFLVGLVFDRLSKWP